MKLELNVSQDLINRGEKAGGYDCPISKAIQEKLSLLRGRVYVFSYKVEVKLNDNTALVAYLPENVTQWIYSFDRGDGPQPISFELEFRQEENYKPKWVY